MARIRTIKPEFWCDEKLSKLPVIDRLTFLGLISMADDYGRVHDNIKVIDAFVFPHTEESVRESLANLSRIIRIRRGTSESGMAIIEIVNWERHQKVDKPQPKSALPHICEKANENKGQDAIRESFANGSRTVRESFEPRPTTNDLLPTTKEQKETPPRKKEKSDSWEIPLRLDTPRIRDLLSRFEAMRSSIRKPIRSRANSSAVLEHFEDEAHLAYALELCIANEYQGLKADYRPSQKQQPEPKHDSRPSLEVLLARGRA